MDLIKRTFQTEGPLSIACNDKNIFFTSNAVRNYNLWSCQKVCEALTFLLDNIYIRFGSKLYRQIVGILLGTNCAPLIADLFSFCYESDFMLSLSENNQSDVIEAFNSTSWYLYDLLNIDNNFFDSMVNRIYPSELQLNKANVSDTEASFMDLHLTISDGFVKTKIYDKRDDFDFDMVNFPFLGGDIPRSTSYHCRETKSVVAIKLPKVCLHHQFHASFRGSHCFGKQVNCVRSFILHNGQF